MNVDKLKDKITEKELNVSEVAEYLGLHRSTLYRKINENGDKLTIREANEIVKMLGLSADEATTIFFSDTVA